VTRATSAFLDVLRLGAAFTVFLAHTAHYWNPALVGAMQVVAHDAVIVFFVLSGYVIAHTAREKCHGARDYVIARLSRLYSVVVPALALTALLWPLGSELDSSLYAQYARSGTGLRYLLTFLHLNETWFFDAYPPANTPFWSLGYEAWYYVLFGVAWFVKRPNLRWGLLVACVLVMGPKVLLLLPAWLVGAAACFWREKWVISKSLASFGFILSTCATLAAMRWLPDWPYAVGAKPWFFSGAAFTDFITSLGWAAMIWSFHRAFGQIVLVEGLHRVIRWCANHTFSLYLYHAPLVIFATALVPPLGMSFGASLSVMGGILLVIIVLGALTEGQRFRWQRLFARIYDLLVGGKLVSPQERQI
jgi:peptidoglycan/LPS O-acetylase OafA/YrhL